MKISTKGRYALRVMIDLGLHNTGDYISLKDIANRQNITPKYLEQIVSTLNKAGFLQSMRGNAGGHRLAKAPEEYNVGDILRTMEGPLASVECTATIEGQSCPLSDECATFTFWKGLDKVINEYVDGFTLQDLLDQASGKGDYSI
jgi:Rrf2 family protein